MSDPVDFHFDDEPMRRLIKAMQSNHVVRIGVFGGTHKEPIVNKNGKGRRASQKPSKMSNADVGFALEYGSKLRRQPARSWLHDPIAKNIEKIVERSKKHVEEMAKTGDPIEFLTNLGHQAEIVIEEAFASGGPGWAPNAPSTIARKHNTAEENMPGSDTGQLKLAVASQVI